jgi:hypothetical protein
MHEPEGMDEDARIEEGACGPHEAGQERAFRDGHRALLCGLARRLGSGVIQGNSRRRGIGQLLARTPPNCYHSPALSTPAKQ